MSNDMPMMCLRSDRKNIHPRVKSSIEFACGDKPFNPRFYRLGRTTHFHGFVMTGLQLRDDPIGRIETGGLLADVTQLCYKNLTKSHRFFVKDMKVINSSSFCSMRIEITAFGANLEA